MTEIDMTPTDCASELLALPFDVQQELLLLHARIQLMSEDESTVAADSLRLSVSTLTELGVAEGRPLRGLLDSLHRLTGTVARAERAAAESEASNGY
jgi:hypothetical protein